MSLTTFWLPSLLMGVAIAVDVMFATLSKFRDQDLSFRNWTGPVTLTHILFPALGYYSFWVLGEAFGAAQFWLGLLGFSFITLFLYEAISEAVDHTPLFELSSVFSRLPGVSRHSVGTFTAVLAVSWDALLSGPGFSITAASYEWTFGQVVGAFFIFGAVVAVIAEVSLKVTLYLRRRHFANVAHVTQLHLFGQFAEWSVIGGFGVLSLWHGLFGNGDLYRSIAIASMVILLLCTLLRRQLLHAARKEAEEIFD